MDLVLVAGKKPRGRRGRRLESRPQSWSSDLIRLAE